MFLVIALRACPHCFTLEVYGKGPYHLTLVADFAYLLKSLHGPPPYAISSFLYTVGSASAVSLSATALPT